MKQSLTLMAILFTFLAVTRAQVAPAAKGQASPVGPLGLPVNGTLYYDLRYAETTQFGGGRDGQQMSIVSGDASYANVSKRLPFSMQYGGGYGFDWAGSPSAGNVFQHLSLSQGMVGRKWNLTASDNVSYSFQTPTIGFSGVPGTGEPIGGSGTITTPDQTVLALNTRTIDNMTTVGFGQRLNYAMSLNLGVTFGQMDFIDGNGENMNTLSANAGITRRLNARNSTSAQYSFSRFNYGANISGAPSTTQISFSQANSAQISFSRQWNRQITTSASAGPQWISSSNSAVVPSSTRFSANASASDTFRFGTASLTYSHGTTGGSGYTLGAESDVFMANFGRSFSFGKNLTLSMNGSYMRTASLIAAEFGFACSINNAAYICLVPLNYKPVTNAGFGGIQATRKLGRYFNAFAGYTAIDQSSTMQASVPNTPLGSNATILNGLNQVISFGIGYSPREKHLRK
jgi:hypothetical protein